MSLIHNKEKDPSNISANKALIKQFARRIYNSKKEEMIQNKEEIAQIMKALFGEVRNKNNEFSKKIYKEY